MAEAEPFLPAPPPRPLSSFVGRRGEIEALGRRLLAGIRLVTLTGPGGSGKTRLAIEVAREVAPHFPGGVAFADLSALRDPAAVPDCVLGALGPRGPLPRDVAQLIGAAGLLLVIDNAEHLVAATSTLVASLLDRCPNLGVLVTSREPLNIGGEAIWPVVSLELPPPDAPAEPGRLGAYDAINLFATRAVEHEPSFALTPENAPLAVSICRRLDGLPLALELAAARVRSLGLGEIHTRLNDSFRLLTGGSRTAVARHRTLRAAVDWSYCLLDAPERRLFGRLAVFVGTFDLRAVESVCSDGEPDRAEVADVLHRLVDKSLVVSTAQPDGGLRYGLIEAVRQYAQERLLAAGEPGIRARHAAYYARLVERLDGGDGDFRTRVDTMTRDYDNVRLALDWASDEDPELEAAIVVGLRWFWRVRGSVREARERTLSALSKHHPAPNRRARLLADAFGWSRQAGDIDAVRAHIEEAAILLDRIDDAKLAARILLQLGVMRALSGDLAAAERDYADGVGRLEGLPPSVELMSLLNNLAMTRLAAGRPAAALAAIERCVSVQAQVGDFSSWLTRTVHTHGVALLALDRLDEARERFLEGLESAAEYANAAEAVQLLDGLACVAARTGEPALCLELLAVARICERAAGVGDVEPWAGATAEAERSSRSALGPRAARAAWARGGQMDLRAALARARRSAGGPPVRSLPPRKRQIVELVAAGLGNKEIARRLAISERTVDAHLAQLRSQLGLRNRARIVAWAVASGLAGPDAATR